MVKLEQIAFFNAWVGLRDFGFCMIAKNPTEIFIRFEEILNEENNFQPFKRRLRKTTEDYDQPPERDWFSLFC